MEAYYDYSANGQVKKVTYGNGIYTRYTYDDAGRLVTKETRSGTLKGGTSLLKLDYEYDNRDLVT